MCDECYWKDSYEKQIKSKIKYKFELEDLNNSILFFHKHAIEEYVKAKKLSNEENVKYYYGQVLVTAMILKKDITNFSDSLQEMV